MRREELERVKRIADRLVEQTSVLGDSPWHTATHHNARDLRDALTAELSPKFKVGDRVLNGIGSLATISRVVGFEYDRYLYDLAYPGGGVGVNFPEGELVPVPTGSEFSATYRFNGETHGLILRATNRDEAEAKCRTLGATLDGEIG